MKTSNAWKLLSILILLAAGVRAGETHDTVTNYRGYVMAQWAPSVSVASLTNTTGGAMPATGTWHYALAAQNSLGISGAGPVTNVTVATGELVRITWRPVGGATNYLIYRGTVSTSLTQRAIVGLSTSYVDHGTNAWTTNSPASTITNVPALILGRAGVESMEAVTKSQLDAAVSPTGYVNTLTSTDSTVVVSGSGTARVLSVAAFVEGVRTALQAGVSAATGSAATAYSAATNASAQAAAATSTAATAASSKLGYQDTRGFTNSASAFFTDNSSEVVVGSATPCHLGDGVLYIVDQRRINLEAGEASGDWLFGGSVEDNASPATYLNVYATNIYHMGVTIFRSGRITTGALAGVDGASLTNVNATTLAGSPAASYALVSSFGNVGRYTNFPATATSAGAAGQWAVTNVGSTNWLAVWGANFQGTGTNGWGFVQLQRARP